MRETSVLRKILKTLEIKPSLFTQQFNRISKKIEEKIQDEQFLQEPLQINKDFISKYIENICKKVKTLKENVLQLTDASKMHFNS